MRTDYFHMLNKLTTSHQQWKNNTTNNDSTPHTRDTYVDYTNRLCAATLGSTLHTLIGHLINVKERLYQEHDNGTEPYIALERLLKQQFNLENKETSA